MVFKISLTVVIRATEIAGSTMSTGPDYDVNVRCTCGIARHASPENATRTLAYMLYTVIHSHM
jgi:hypothetical protein